MRTVTPIALVLALLATVPAAAAVERADTVATYIGGIGFHPISGDGSRVVFSDSAGGDDEIFVWEQETGLTQLTDESNKPGNNFVSALALDYDGTAAAVVANGDLADTGATTDELYRWTEESGWERLTFTQGPRGVAPPYLAISEAGNRIAFISRDDYTGENRDGELQVFLWDEGVGFTQVTHGFPCGPAGGNFLRDLSGDGSRILFSSRCQFGNDNDDLGSDLFLWDEVSGVRALTETKNGGTSASGQLNRDGTIAALVSDDDLTGHGEPGDRLYRWLDGQGFELLTKHPTSRFAPSISADGTRIVYSAENGQGNPAINPEGAEELFFWQQGQPDVAALTDSAQTDTDFGNGRPHLSADGTRLSMFALRAFDAPADLRVGHYVIDVLSSQQARPNLLVNGSFDTGLGGWQPGAAAIFSPEDGKADPASGSAIKPNDLANGNGGVGVTQCLPAGADTEYVLSALLRVVPGGNTGAARVRVVLFPTKDCVGGATALGSTVSITRDDGAWIAVHGRFVTAADTVSANVALFADKNEPGGYLEAGFDDVSLRLDNKLKVVP